MTSDFKTFVIECHLQNQVLQLTLNYLFGSWQICNKHHFFINLCNKYDSFLYLQVIAKRTGYHIIKQQFIEFINTQINDLWFRQIPGVS